MSKNFSNKFSKYQGAGNDFILIDDRALFFDTTQIPFLCRQKFGIGADGLILLQSHLTADFRMRIFNRDGSEAESCGNGLRCFARFITDLGFPQKTYQIAIHDKIVEASFVEDLIRIDLGPVPEVFSTILEGKEIHSTNTGVPHAIVFVEDLNAIDLPKEGATLRYHPHFEPHGTNVNFACVQDDVINVRTYERGIEGESLACGTGAAAVALATLKKYQCPSKMKMCFAGGTIMIQIEKGRLLTLGNAEKVFDGYLS